MLRQLPFVLLALQSLLLAPLAASSLERARELYRLDLLEDARSETYKVVYGSETRPSQRAAALDLLGLIAADLGDYRGARDAWAELLREHPDSELARPARTKLSLVEALLAVRGERTGSTSVDAPAAELPGAAPAAPQRIAPADDSAAAPAHGVLVGGSGEPRPALRDTLIELTGFLNAAGVRTRGVPPILATVDDYEAARPRLAQAIHEQGAVSALYVVTRYGFRERIRIYCHGRDGTLLWRESVAGGTGSKPSRRASRRDIGVNQKLVERIEAKLASHVGDACLPTDEGAAVPVGD